MFNPVCFHKKIVWDVLKPFKTTKSHKQFAPIQVTLLWSQSQQPAEHWFGGGLAEMRGGWGIQPEVGM